jgi:TDG/mug DNA glycosylase family protein
MPRMTQPKPTRAELLAAAGTPVPDLLAPDLRVLFCGINPGLYSAVTLHHFARPGNRFWKALHRSGFTDRLLSPHEDASLPEWRLGVTNLVARTTATADELSTEELRDGARRLGERLEPLRPRAVAILGVGAYRKGFGRPRATVGPQDERLGGSRLWLLPNPSGRTAAYQLDGLVKHFRALREATVG